MDPAVRWRWKRAFVACSRSAMCALGRSSEWARQSAKERSSWRNYTPFSQLRRRVAIVRAFEVILLRPSSGARLNRRLARDSDPGCKAKVDPQVAPFDPLELFR